MRLTKEISNGILIFFGISFFFLMMELFGFSKIIYLRILNAAIIYYGVRCTLKSNFKDDETGYVTNLISAGLTAFIGVFLSILGLTGYLYLQGGDDYVGQLSGEFIFGGNPTANQYLLGLFFEGIASAVIMVFIAMQLWRNKTASSD